VRCGKEIVEHNDVVEMFRHWNAGRGSMIGPRGRPARDG
jgi:hypothetical protein